MDDYDHIPIIDWGLSQGSENERAQFLDELRSSMINIGFLYLKNHPVPKDIVDAVIDYTPKFFDLPQPTKDAVDMVNCPHFHGYLRVGEEGMQGIHQTDEREQFNFAGDRICQYKDGEPEYLKLHGDALWPQEGMIPGFKKTMSDYYDHVEDLSYKFTQLVSEALGLAPDALDVFFGDDHSKLQPRCKLMKYPRAVDGKNTIGIGAHVDGSILTFLLQASKEPGLEVLNRSGAWIAAPPIDGTFVINLGRALEKVTRRVAIATSHRVMSPVNGPRYSVAFFSSASMTVRLADHLLTFPPEVIAMKDERDEKAGTRTEFKFSDNDRELAGIVVLNGKIKHHPDIAEKFYPSLFKKFYPDGKPLHRIAAY